MSKIAAIEDAIIACIKETMRDGDKSLLRTVEWAPPDWDDDYIKRVMRTVPGVFVIFEGGPAQDQGSATTKMNTKWTIVAASAKQQDAKRRARGGTQDIGCYQILEACIPALNNFVISDVGTLTFVDWSNEIALKLEDQALMVQSAAFDMLIDLPAIVREGDLVPFRRAFTTYDLHQPAGSLQAKDNVELPQ